MRLVEVTGSDTVGAQEHVAKLAARSGGSRIERIDLATDPDQLARSLHTPDLIGGPKVILVGPPERMTAAIARSISDAPLDATVVFHGAKPVSSAVRKLLPTLETFQYPLPSSRDAARWVQQVAEQQGITLSARCTKVLAAAATTADGAAHVRGVLHTLQLAGNGTPDDHVVIDLLGPVGSEEPLWAVADAVASGHLERALLPTDMDPIPALSVTATRLLRIAACLQGGDVDDMPKLLGVSPAAFRMLTNNVRVRTESVIEAFDTIVNAELETRDTAGPIEIRSIATAGLLRAAELMRR